MPVEGWQLSTAAAVGGASGVRTANALNDAWQTLPQPVRDYIYNEAKGYVTDVVYNSVVTWLQNKFTLSRSEAKEVISAARDLKDMIILPTRANARAINKRPGLRSMLGRSRWRKGTYYKKRYGYKKYSGYKRYGYRRYRRY